MRKIRKKLLLLAALTAGALAGPLAAADIAIAQEAGTYCQFVSGDGSSYDGTYIVSDDGVVCVKDEVRSSWGKLSRPSFKMKKFSGVTRSEAKSIALNYAGNNCPRAGTSSTRKCLDTAIMSDLIWYSPGRWTTEIAVWECWKVDPFCKDRKSARYGASREIRINYDGSVDATSGWRNFP